MKVNIYISYMDRTVNTVTYATCKGHQQSLHGQAPVIGALQNPSIWNTETRVVRDGNRKPQQKTTPSFFFFFYFAGFIFRAKKTGRFREEFLGWCLLVQDTSVTHRVGAQRISSNFILWGRRFPLLDTVGSEIQKPVWVGFPLT